MSESFFDFRTMSGADWGALPPLVKEGQNREEVLESIVSKWLTPSAKAAELDDPDEAIEAHVADGGFYLDGVALVDGNTDEPIDLGELLRMVEECLRAEGAGEAFEPRPDLFVLLRRCRIDSCNCEDVVVRPRFAAFQSQFAHDARWKGATFGDGATLEEATFGDGANLGEATFGDGANLEGATFGDGARFWEATFGDGARFYCAKFGDGARFTSATFGDGAGFHSAKFGDGAGFDSATFGDEADFSFATFGDEADFWDATFDDRAGFDSATFGDGADFWRATFGDRAGFSDAGFGDGARFLRAVFGGGASFSHARIPGADLRSVNGFVPDETLIRGAHFSARAEDPWSKLRAAYTGPRLIFNLMFLAWFFLPLLGRTVGWAAIGAAEVEFAASLPMMYEKTRELDGEHPQVAAWMRATLDEIERNAPGGAADRWRETRVIDPVLGWSQGALFWLPAIMLLVYNVGRGFLTYVVSPMRDAEERSGISPRYRVPSWKRVKGRLVERHEEETKAAAARIDLYRQSAWEYLCGYLEAYGWLVPIHKWMNRLLWVAIASFIVNAVNWLFFQRVWMLQG